MSKQKKKAARLLAAKLREQILNSRKRSAKRFDALNKAETDLHIAHSGVEQDFHTTTQVFNRHLESLMEFPIDAENLAEFIGTLESAQELSVALHNHRLHADRAIEHVRNTLLEGMQP